MKKLLMILSITLLSACMPGAEKIGIGSSLKPRKISQSLEVNKDIDKYIREINFFSYPREEDADNISFTDGDMYFNRDKWNSVFSTLPYGDKYSDGILPNKTNMEKSRDTTSAIIAIGDARDLARKSLVANRLKKRQLINLLKDTYFKKYPCYEILEEPNQKKCLLNPIPNVTSEDLKIARSCKNFKRRLRFYKKIAEDSRIPTDGDTAYLLTKNQIKEYKRDIKACKAEENGQFKVFQKAISKAKNIRSDGKGLVREMLNQMELDSGEYFLATIATKIDEDTSRRGKKKHKSILDIDLKTMTIREIKLAITFNGIDTGEQFRYYGPEFQNMSQPRITYVRNIMTGKSYPLLHFDIYVNEGELVISTDGGLSIDTHGSFGLRVSGKTLWKYRNGVVRKGPFKFELSYKE